MDIVNKRVFTLPTKEKEFFRYYIELIKPFLNKITNKEADILAELIYQNYLKKDIKNKIDRFKLILESSNRRKIENNLNISSSAFRNGLNSLKNRKILDDNNLIKDIFLIEPTDTFELTFNFKIKSNEQE